MRDAEPTRTCTWLHAIIVRDETLRLELGCVPVSKKSLDPITSPTPLLECWLDVQAASLEAIPCG